MATVILVRHGRTQANATAMLAGRQPGVRLDEVGRNQADRAAARLRPVQLARLVSSPLERTWETAEAIARGQRLPLEITAEDGVVEVDYGAWQGQRLADLSKDPLWHTVQHQPSAVTFPGGEALLGAATRAISAVRRHDDEVAEQRGEHAVWALVSHGDIIKAILGEALGAPFDEFQRIVVDPASVSVVRFTEDRPYVLATNTREGDLDWLAHPTGEVVGGGAGPATSGDES